MPVSRVTSQARGRGQRAVECPCRGGAQVLPLCPMWALGSVLPSGVVACTWFPEQAPLPPSCCDARVRGHSWKWSSDAVTFITKLSAYSELRGFILKGLFFFFFHPFIRQNLFLVLRDSYGLVQVVIPQDEVRKVYYCQLKSHVTLLVG